VPPISAESSSSTLLNFWKMHRLSLTSLPHSSWIVSSVSPMSNCSFFVSFETPNAEQLVVFFIVVTSPLLEGRVYLSYHSVLDQLRS